MVEQIKSINSSARNGQLIKRAPQEILDEVLLRLHACFKISLQDIHYLLYCFNESSSLPHWEQFI
jgi:hypothetical protein